MVGCRYTVSSRVHLQVQHYKRNSTSVRAHELFSIFRLQKKVGVHGENFPKVALKLRSHLVPSV